MIIIQTYHPYDPQSTVRVEETIIIKAQRAFLRHIPKQGSIVIEGFVETSSLNPQPNQFSCQYFTETLYRDANRVLNFNAQHNGETLNISYIAVGTVVTADDMNEIKAHLDNPDIHGGGSGLCILGTDSIAADGGLWFKQESVGAVLKLKYGDWIYSYNPDSRYYIGEDEIGAHLALSGVAEDRHYIQLPGNLFTQRLVSATSWSFEIKFATHDYTDSANQSPSQLNVKPLLCFPSNSLLEKNTFNLCVENHCLRLRGTYTGKWINTYKVVDDDKIHRVTFTYDGSNFRLYCDGQFLGSYEHTFQFLAKNSDRPLRIAFTGYSPSWLQLDFYELRVWNKALSDQELFQPVTTTTSYLLAWYIPDNPETLHDIATSYGTFDATIYGKPPYVLP